MVPARDEAARLPGLLESLRGELVVGDEVVVVDDQSSDGTAGVARRAGARVIEVPDLPPGWAGKNWACATGAGAAVNDVLVFLDADTRVDPGGLDRLVVAAEGCDGLYSVQPWHEVPRPVERLGALCNLVAVMGTGAFAPAWGRGLATGAFGPCLVTTSSDYRRAGGHASVRGSVVDDLALAGRYRAAGLAVCLQGGRGTISYRMYPEGFRALVLGFTKNLALGAGSVHPIVGLLVAGWMAACVTPLVLVERAPLVGAACYLAVAVQVHVALRRIGSFGVATAALYLVPLVVFLGIFLLSLVHLVTGRGVSWKGRSVS